MQATSITAIQRLVVSSFVIVQAAAIPGPLFAQDDSALRAQVEVFQHSLKTAWDADDRDAVLKHFEHGDVLPPTRSQYSMLGRFPFWEKPLASVTRNGDGTLTAEFIMDPESDQPAMRMKFTFITTPNGGLQVKSTATPEQLAEGQRRLKERPSSAAEISNVESALAARPAFDSELLPVFQEAFWKMLEEQAAGAGQTLTQEIRGMFIFRALGELHGEDKAVLFTLVTSRGRAQLTVVGFVRQAGSWVVVTEGFRETADGVNQFLGDSTGRRVLRGEGLSVEQLPAYHRYVLTDLREQYGVAEDAGETGRMLDLLEHALAGRSLMSMWEAEDAVRWGPEDVGLVRLGKQALGETEGIISFEVVDEDGDVEFSPVRVVREGEGWFIAGPYETPSDLTRNRLDDVGSALRDFKEANKIYPNASSLEQLYAALQSVRPELEAVATDAWGTPFRYVLSADAATYRLISAGADRQFNHGDWDPTPARIRDMESLDPNEDIVHENGRFARWHKRGIW